MGIISSMVYPNAGYPVQTLVMQERYFQRPKIYKCTVIYKKTKPEYTDRNSIILLQDIAGFNKFN